MLIWFLFHRSQGNGAESGKPFLDCSRINSIYLDLSPDEQEPTESKAKERTPMQKSQRNHTEKEDCEKDNPALSKVIERNIRTLIHLRTKAARERSLQSRIADGITSFSG